MILTQDFKDLLNTFNAHQVEYMVVGAFAVIQYTGPRSTGDMDVWVKPTPENAKKVFAALALFGAPLQVQDVSINDFEQRGLIYQIGLPPKRIDILTSIEGVEFDDAWKDKEWVIWDEQGFFVLGYDALVKNKTAVGRDKDKIDLHRLKLARDNGKS